MATETVFPAGVLHQKLESGLILSEFLFYPEISRLGNRRQYTIDALKENWTKRLEQAGSGTHYFRRLGTAATAKWVTFELPPPLRQVAWQTPVQLRFPSVVWSHGTEAIIARVPALDIEVLVEKLDELDAALEREIVAALRRTGLAASLAKLARYQRTQQFRVEWENLPVALPSLKQKAQHATEEATKEEKTSVLKQTATLLSALNILPSYEVEDTVRLLAEALTAGRPQSVLLIGPSGVGKTTCVRELIRRRDQYQLAATPFYQTSGSRIVAGQCGFGMWQERCKDLVREASKKRAILHLGNLVELMEVGKSEHNHTGIAGFLRPAIARGELLCIAECTAEQLPMIEREDPQLADAFRTLRVEEPDATRGLRILQQYTADPARGALGKHLAHPKPEALLAIDRLHRRYATYSAFPGRPIRFIEHLRRDLPKEERFGEAEVLSAFTRETGLPRVLLDPTVPLDVATTRQWFAQRVIGQSEAVHLVADLLATIKAGLTRPNRPIASLLFIGPTGVGKTEMAKSLAEFLFGSKDRLTRFDMSEYADPLAVQRLAGTAFGSEGLLTAKVREQPFCVLLLDEFEKAHPAFLDLMLQVLGEARLTDAGGRLADFRNTVIILTSNLGAETYQMGHPGFGTSAVDQHEAKQHFVREVEKYLRPEMYNRLDRLVPFAPLDAQTIDHIAQREWEKVLHRDGVRFRGVSVAASDDVVPLLAKKGFDARYGARPLKRAIERELLAPLAEQMNHYSAEAALDVQIHCKEEQLRSTVKPKLEAGRIVEVVQTAGAAASLFTEITQQRRIHQLLAQSSVVRELDNEVYQLEQLEKRLLHRKQNALSDGDQKRLARLGQLRELANEVRRQRTAMFDLEDQMAFAFHRQEPLPPSIRNVFTILQKGWDDLLLRLFALQHPRANAISLILFSESRTRLESHVQAYLAVAEELRFGVSLERYELIPQDALPPIDAANSKREASTEKPLFQRWGRDALENYLLVDQHGEPLRIILKRTPLHRERWQAELSHTVCGLGMRITGSGSNARFLREHGLHQFQMKEEYGISPDVLVEVSNDELRRFLPPFGVTRRGAFTDLPPMRIYREATLRIIDTKLAQAFVWYTRTAESIKEITAAHMRDMLQELVLE